MKSLLYTALLSLAAMGAAFAQNNPQPFNDQFFYAKTGNPDWLTVREGVELSAAILSRQNLADLGLSANDELRLYRTDVDDLGFTHYRYHQYFRGVRVDGAELLLHEKDGRVRTLNGKLVRGLQADVRTTLNADQALQRALQHRPAQRYMWQAPGAEALLRRIKNDPAATFFPKPELVLVAPGFTQQAADFQAAWRVEVFADQPAFRHELFVSAFDGALLESVEMLCEQNTPGTAHTKYSGERQIFTDSIAPDQYRLVETTRGNGIETYDMKRGTDHGAAVDFLDADNNWNNVNPAKDEVATDAHWGAEMTYDYFLQKHNYASLDGFNMPMIGFVHFDQNWSNAQWTGEWARYGDGNNSTWAPLTSLDVVGHEFVHGVTDFTANLRYRNESGALNESFSDIFGTAIEFFAQPEQADWLIGEDFVILGPPLRDMAFPKKQQNPDTYKGEHWVSGAADNGGVHSNSGVQNKWFFLLTQGGSGRNDNSFDYAVTGQGFEAASAIAFRNLRYYLAVLSEYADAREGSMQAAEDLYGACSPEFFETVNAWNAVGVGKPLAAYDLRSLAIVEPQPLSCGLTGAEPVTLQFRYNGCNADLAAGEKIPVAYQVEDHPVVWDTLTLSANLSASDTINFTFSVPPAEFAVPGSYHLRCWTAFGSDQNAANNELRTVVESLADQDSDLRLQKINQPASGCLLGSERPEIEIGYWGCDLLPVNTPLQLFYRLNGGAVVSETINTPTTLNTGKSFTHIFNTPVNLNANGEYDLDVWLNYNPDQLTGNDSLFNLRIVNPVRMVRDEVLTFENSGQSLDTVFTRRGSDRTRGEISTEAAKTGAYGYLTTGGNIAQALLFGEAVLPTAENVWNTNERFRSQLCVCADLSGMAGAELRFDHKQTFSLYYYKTVGYNAPFASSLQVLANGEPLSPTYKPTTHSFDGWKSRKFDLKDYLGGTLEICFEMMTGISPELDTFGSKGDRVMLDNIAIVGQPVSGTSIAKGAEPDWSVMPNPSKGAFTIAYRTAEAQELRLTVVDALGQMVLARTVAVGVGDNRIPLQLNGAAPGIYQVQIGQAQRRSVRRLVVQH